MTRGEFITKWKAVELKMLGRAVPSPSAERPPVVEKGDHVLYRKDRIVRL